jgi:hypothetical protein
VARHVAAARTEHDLFRPSGQGRVASGKGSRRSGGGTLTFSTKAHAPKPVSDVHADAPFIMITAQRMRWLNPSDNHGVRFLIDDVRERKVWEENRWRAMTRERPDMDACEHLLVRVNNELVLDAGTCERVTGSEGSEWIVHPPKKAIFRQVIDYLKAKPDPGKRSRATASDREGVLAAAVTLRWGSYFAVIADRSKPLWDAADTPGTSRISDDEMARINIEASAAMAEWIDFYRTDANGHMRLAARAVAYLPMPWRAPRPHTGAFWHLSDPEHAGRLEHAAEQGWSPEGFARARADAERHPTRVLANAAVNVAWRNGPVEDIHAGQARGHPLDRRRVTAAEEDALMTFASGGMAMVMAVCRRLASERPPRPWPRQVLPYALGEMMLVTPSGWTLTEESRAVRLCDSLYRSPTAP